MDRHEPPLAGVWRELEDHDERLGALERECALRWPALEALVSADTEAKSRRQWELEQRAEQRAERSLYLSTAQKLGAFALGLIGLANFVLGLLGHHP